MPACSAYMVLLFKQFFLYVSELLNVVLGKRGHKETQGQMQGQKQACAQVRFSFYIQVRVVDMLILSNYREK